MTLDLTTTFLVRNPPLERLLALIEYMSAISSEFIIVDTGSTYAEIKAMESMNRFPLGLPRVEIIHRPWENDFAWARNAALPFINRSWTLHLDPDELPNMKMMQYIEKVVTNDKFKPEASGYLFFSVEYFDGIREPEHEYQWHTRLFRSGYGRWYRPLDELVQLGGMDETKTRGTQVLPKAPKDAYFIHTKDEKSIWKSEKLYAEMRRGT